MVPFLILDFFKVQKMMEAFCMFACLSNYLFYIAAAK